MKKLLLLVILSVVIFSNSTAGAANNIFSGDWASDINNQFYYPEDCDPNTNFGESEEEEGNETEGAGLGKWKLGPNANRPGGDLTPEFKKYMDALSKRTSYELVITSATNHNKMSSSGKVSDHWAGNAADFWHTDNKFGTSSAEPGKSVPRGDEIAEAAYITAGMSASEAKKKAKQGGLINYNGTFDGKSVRIQVIWKINEGNASGGNHKDHVHVGFRINNTVQTNKDNNILKRLANLVGPQTAHAEEATTAHEANDEDVYILGDSITRGAREDLKKYFNDEKLNISKINADDGRAISKDTVGSNPTGLEAIEQDKQYIKEAGTVVIALGTNSGVEDLNTQIPKLINAIKSINSSTKILWVNTFVKDKEQRDKINNTIDDLSDKEGYVIIDTADEKIELSSDGVHPTAEGSKTFAGVVAKGASFNKETPNSTPTDSNPCCPTPKPNTISDTGKSISGTVSARVGYGISKKGQENLQKAVVEAGEEYNVDPNLIAALYYAENSRTADSTNNADSASGTPATGDGKWRDPAKPYGEGDSWPPMNSYSAMGPWQFITSTWQSLKPKGKNNTSDRNDLFISAKAAANYAKTNKATKGASSETIKKFIFNYNHSNTYVQSVFNTYKYLSGEESKKVSGGGDNSEGTTVSCICEDPSNSSVDVKGGNPKNIEGFVQKYADSALAASKKVGIPYDFMLAQILQESGLPLSTLNTKYNNFGGIKWNSPKDGKATPFMADGMGLEQPARYRWFDSPEQGITEQAQFFVKNSRYKEALKYPKDPLRFAEEVAKAGYATDPAYASKLKNIITTTIQPELKKQGKPLSKEVTMDVSPAGGDLSGTPQTASGCISTTSITTVDGFTFPVGDLKKSEVGTNNKLPCRIPEGCHHDQSSAFDIGKGKNGILVGGSEGLPVYAIEDGEIIAFKPTYNGIPSCPHYQLKGKSGWVYWYGHTANPSIKVGSKVKSGDKIAEIGPSKCASNTAPHLHIDRGKPKGHFGGGVKSRDSSMNSLINKLWEALP